MISIFREQTYAYQREELVGGLNWDLGIDMYRQLYLK